MLKKKKKIQYKEKIQVLGPNSNTLENFGIITLKFKTTTIKHKTTMLRVLKAKCGQHAMLCYAKSLQSCPTLCDPMDCSLPGSSVHGIFQARVLKWGAIKDIWIMKAGRWRL